MSEVLRSECRQRARKQAEGWRNKSLVQPVRHTGSAQHQETSRRQEVIRRTPIKRSTTPIPRRRKRPRISLQPKGQVVDERFLDWIRCLPCIVCFAWLFTELAFAIVEAVSITGTDREAAHVGNRGLGQLCSSREVIPLCPACHRTGPEAHHGPLGKCWWEHHQLQRVPVIKELNRWYEAA